MILAIGRRQFRGQRCDTAAARIEVDQAYPERAVFLCQRPAEPPDLRLERVGAGAADGLGAAGNQPKGGCTGQRPGR
ncbi:hypothetical protein ACFQZ2_15495, partial [Streptomonospora algeriensis]